jgi:hypothetical protein
MAPSFLTRMRNGSHTFNKDQSSISTISLPLPQNGTSQRPVLSSTTPPDFPPDAQPGQQVDGRELAHDRNNTQAVDKNQSLSLRKRFFSKSGAPVATTPRPMTINMNMNDGDGMSVKEKLRLLMLSNGKIDMVMVLQAIEERYATSY